MSSNTIRRTGLLSACGAAAALIALAGCSTSEGASSTSQAVASSQAKTSGESTAGSSAEAAAHNAADVSFNQMMIPHHQQAVAMADLVPSRTDNVAVRELAGQIKNAQQPEIDQMTQRLESWGVSPGAQEHGSQQHGSMASGSTAHGTMGMSGMMSDQDMTAIENARGAEFDRLWLQGMISHHQGAIDMANTELADGVDPGSRALAEQIKKTQQTEIDRMRSMLGQ